MDIWRKRYNIQPTTSLVITPIQGGYSQVFRNTPTIIATELRCTTSALGCADYVHNPIGSIFQKHPQPDLVTSWFIQATIQVAISHTWAGQIHYQTANIIIFHLCLKDFTPTSHLAVSNKQVLNNTQPKCS